MIARQFFRVLCYRNFKRFLIFSALFIVTFVIIKHISRWTPQHKHSDNAAPAALGDNINNIVQRDISIDGVQKGHADFTVPLRVVPESFVASASCPACYGSELCEDIHSGKLKIEIPDRPTKASQQGIYFGLLDSRVVMVKSYTLSHDNVKFKRYQEFLCKNVTGTEDCNVATAITSSFVTKDGALAPKHLKHIYKIAQTKPDELSNLVCVTETMMDLIKDYFGVGPAEELTPDELSLLYTSLAVEPEAINFRFLGGSDSEWAFPEFYGSCGRLLVMEHPGTPLLNFLTATWEKRAELVIQIIQLIDVFLNGDSSWMVVYSGFNFDNFYVNEEGEINILNAEDIVIIDRISMGDYDSPEDAEICNEECFSKYAGDLYDMQSNLQEQACTKGALIATNAMFSVACKNLFSDLSEHHQSQTQPHPGQGLLHHPPERNRHTLLDIVRECVQETAPGGRIGAIDEIQEILSQYTQQKLEK